jgi:2-dehydro-3-deoxyphosphooctonate aldolase (KDO 8-P synthase)
LPVMSSENLFNTLKSGTFFIAGPCVIESRGLLDEVGSYLSELRRVLNVPVIFKASFDKANRTSVTSFRGPGLEKGMKELQFVKDKYNLPIVTDIHEPWQAKPVAEIADVLQIPAFLCRQTDLLLAAGQTERIVNIKKAQFLSGQDMQWCVKKVESTGNRQIMLTERGNMYGYNNLVVDFRNIVDMKTFGYPVIMDVTHSVQRPGGEGGSSGGNREYVVYLARAAKAVGADGYFFEVHPNPDKALSDGPNMLTPGDFAKLAEELIA